MMMKSMNQRLSEALEIRKGVKQMGIEVLDDVRAKLAYTCNRFIQHEESSVSKYKLDRYTVLVVTLAAEENRESGITLEQH